MNGEFRFGVFNIFLSAEFLRADQLWKINHWEAVVNSPFPMMGEPSPIVNVLPEPEPVSVPPAP